MAEINWPWQYNFPPFYTLQPHAGTRVKQLKAWKALILDYCKANNISTLDVNEAQKTPLFNNPSIQKTLSVELIVFMLDEMAKTGHAAPIDKAKVKWEIYWHSADEWGNIIYQWASDNGMKNTVCTLFELTEGENTAGEEFHGLDQTILVKALKALEINKRCELMEFDDNQGVKFF